MKQIYAWGVVVCAAGVGAIVTSNGQPSQPGREVRIKGGRTAINFIPANLKENKIAVDFHKEEVAECDTCSLPGFKMEKADLRFRVVEGKLAKFDKGALSHKGEFKLTSGKKTITSKRMTVAPDAKTGELALSIDSAKGSIVAFELRKPVGLQKKTDTEVVIPDMEIVVSEDLASELGNPELAGETVGSMTLYAQSEPTDGGGEIEYAEMPAAGLDVSISAMGSLGVASNPTGKVGTYPNGRTGLTMSTTSCNVGTVNIPWNAPMQPTHPIIALNLYRVQNGRFEQVGWSWLKHGFLATNSGGCGSCQHPGTGSLLGPGCSDTYGPGNNGDRTYLGPRDEVNPFTGVWTCTNSWFSNYQNDCVRRNPGQASMDAVDHRLDVLDSDLGNANSQYFYEAYYILPNDIDTYNNVASRGATFAWGGSSWSVNTTSVQVQGPAINRWGEMRSTATPTTEGDVIVAVQTTDNGNGTWRYEYAVYNHNLDRQVRTFSVPMPYGALVTNIGFRDIDRDANNGWTATHSDYALTWNSPTFGSSGTNPLKYSSVFNFRFDANVPPASSSSTMGLFKPGSNPSLTAGTRGPLFLEPVNSYTLVNGNTRGGNLQSLQDVDGNKLVLGPEDSGSRSGTGVIATDTAPAGAITSVTVGVRSSNTLPNGNATQTIALFNWNTNEFEQVDSRAATNADSSITLNLTSNAARFVNASSREVRVRVLHASDLGVSGNRWTMAFDQIGLKYN